MTATELARVLVLALHLLSVAAVLVGCLLQLGSRRARPLRPMVAGAAVASLTGVALVVIRLAADLPVDLVKITVKLVVAALLLAALVVSALQRRPDSPTTGASHRYLQVAGLLALGNVVVALAWN
jgi:hypothetical protein